ncbi:MAG: alpha/beta hydrolase [Ectothiorhodospiraceae bacterium]|nr:alpha/beta hydrolase [Ectothiorhodospiraceae bacterium]
MTSEEPSPLPQDIRSRSIENGNGLTMHMLEAGFQGGERPCIVLLHGFPELAYSWRKIMPPLAAAGFHVVAPDQRGYGRTTGWDGDYGGDLGQYRMLNLVQDLVGLVSALGLRSVAAVVGHDFGSPVAAWCALIRPDMFRSVVMMSAPFGGPPAFPPGAPSKPEQPPRSSESLHQALARLDPPRKHYQWYYGTREANADMLGCPQGVHAFLRAYYHQKSGDWSGNAPQPLASMSARELARMPTYYIMRMDQDMAETVAEAMPEPEQIAACRWLPDDELAMYSSTYERTGFQGGLQWYRAAAHPPYQQALRLFSGLGITVPSCFIAGDRDWGVYQTPGAFQRMRSQVCSRMLGCHLIPGAGHWVQQEAPEAVTARLLAFLHQANSM